MMILSLGLPAPGDLSSFLRSSIEGPGDALGAGAGDVLVADGAGLNLFCCRAAEDERHIHNIIRASKIADCFLFNIFSLYGAISMRRKNSVEGCDQPVTT